MLTATNLQTEEYKMEDIINANQTYFMVNLKLTGVSHRQAQEVITERIIRNDVTGLTLARDANNEFDQYAVMVLCEGSFVGWIPKGPNSKLAAAMDRSRMFAVQLHKILEHPDHQMKGLSVNIIETC